MRTIHIVIIAVGLLALLVVPRRVGAQGEESQVVATVQRFFDSMSARDTAAAKEILVLEATYFSVRRDTDGTTLRGSTNREYVDRLAEAGDDLLERMHDPEVMVHDDIAVVWTPYDFYINGTFSHCGVDAFSLVKIDGRWKIAGVIYTVEPECDAKDRASEDVVPDP